MTASRDGLHRYLMLDRDPLGRRGTPPASATAEARHVLAGRVRKAKPSNAGASEEPGYAAVHEALTKPRNRRG